MIEVAPLALLPLDSCRALHPLLSFLTLLSNGSLVSDSNRVLPELLATCEDPLHAVLKSPLLLSRNEPLVERVDVGSIVDLVHEVLCGVESVLGFVLGLLIIVDAREDTRS